MRESKELQRGFSSTKTALQPRILVAFVGDVEDMPAGLAVDGVGFMPLKAALRARKKHLVGTEERLRQPDEQRYADDHGDDGGELAGDTRQDDVTEAGLVTVATVK